MGIVGFAIVITSFFLWQKPLACLQAILNLASNCSLQPVKLLKIQTASTSLAVKFSSKNNAWQIMSMFLFLLLLLLFGRDFGQLTALHENYPISKGL